jgi:hypothetical protein
MAYEFRTKSAQSGGLENNGQREGILGLSKSIAVRRFAHEAPVFVGDFCGLASQRRMLNADGLAEGEELGSNVLHLQPINRAWY